MLALDHARQRVNAPLHRHGIRYPEPTKCTQAHQGWLRRQHFDSLALQFTYDADVELAELLAAHLKRVDKEVAAVAKDCQYAPVIEALKCLRGIEVTTAFGLAVEIGDWTRFTGASVGSYLAWSPANSPRASPGARARSPRPAANTPAKTFRPGQHRNRPGTRRLVSAPGRTPAAQRT